MKSRRKKKFFIWPLFIFIFGVTFFFTLYSINKKMMPAAISMSRLVLQNKMNSLISVTVQNITQEKNLSAKDFYEQTDGGIQVSTLLINSICAQTAAELSDKIGTQKFEEIKVPVGVLTGIDFLSNYGPKYPVIILPMGTAEVDYESSFESVGINQINFQIWLNVKMDIKIVNPNQEAAVEVSRKLSLVNTVIRGEIPNFYFLPLSEY